MIPSWVAVCRASERRLFDLLGLSEDELCAVLDVDPLTLLSGQLEHRSELPIHDRPARRGVRARGAGGVVAIGRGIFTGTVHAVDRMNGHARESRRAS
jgi:hypothetical protein